MYAIDYRIRDWNNEFSTSLEPQAGLNASPQRRLGSRRVPADREILEALFRVAVSAADPAKALVPLLPADTSRSVKVIGAGKGSSQMAQALEENWDGPVSGTVVTRYGYAVQCERIRVLEAAHPIPDEAGFKASEQLFSEVVDLGEEDLVVALISGGGSALLPMPQEGLRLEDEVAVNEALLASGAPIAAMNAIRKQVSRIKGGRLALAACPAMVDSYVMSDVPGDDPAQVASGPTVPDHSTAKDALSLIENYRIPLPQRVADHIRRNAFPAPLPGHRCFARNETTVVASAGKSLEAAQRKCREHGLEALILSDSMEGEAREAGRILASLAKETALRNRPFRKPVVLLSGGETTVTMRGGGKGGRNTEFLLSFALEVDGCSGITALAADTDGIDGTEANAGALATGETVKMLRSLGVDPQKLLAGNDSYSAFERIGDLFFTGPTGINVNDFRAILVR